MEKKLTLKPWFIVLFVIIITFFTTACSNQSTQGSQSNEGTNGSSGSAKSDKEPIKIGILTPLTGPVASWGIETQEGADLAAKQINDAGGILDGRKIELVYVDDKSSPEEAVSGFKKMQTQGIKFITGTQTSSPAIALGNLANTADVVYMITGAYAPQPLENQTKGNIFALNPTNQMAGEVFHSWIANKLKPKTVFVIAENNDFGLNEVETLKKNWEGSDAPEIIAIEKFESTETNFSVLLAKVREKNPDAIYVASGGGVHQANIFKQADQLGLKTVKLTNPGTLIPAFVDEGGKSVEGVVNVDMYHHSIENSVNKQFVQDFQAMYNKLPSQGHERAWESVYLLAKAIDKAETAEDIAAISKIIKESTWELPRGTLTFNNIGRAESELIMLEIKDGEIVLYKE